MSGPDGEPGPRVLALDYGSARCGCALSDVTGALARPVAPVLAPASEGGLRELVAIVAREGVGRVVVGLPLSLSGGDSDQTRETRRFAATLGERLEGSGVEVELYDERFTTKMARARGGTGPGPGLVRGRGRLGRATRSGTSEDSRAAAVLLQSWLDARSGGGGR